MFDAKTIDVEYVKEKIGLVGMMMPFNQGGTANTSAIFRAGMELIDPDMADEVIDNDQVATEQEVKDTMDMVSNAFNGLEPVAWPVHANHQLRLQTIQQATVGSQNPRMKERLAQNPDTVEILQR